MAAGHSLDVARWLVLFDELMGRIAGRFARVEPRRRAGAFVLGLLAELPRKNCSTIAGHVGDATPDGMQHLLERAWMLTRCATTSAAMSWSCSLTPMLCHRWHDWAWVAIEPGRPGCHWLLIRRHRRTHELAYYRCYPPAIIGWAPWCGLPGAGGPVRRTSRPARPGRPRRTPGPHRDLLVPGVTLAMLALAFLTAACITERGQRPPPAGMVPLSRNEIAHLTAAIITQPARARHRRQWPTWRRAHQHRARTCHYQHQAAHDP